MPSKLTWCSVRNGKFNTKKRTLGSYFHFFTFPQDEDLKNAWIKACGRDPNDFDTENGLYKIQISKNFIFTNFAINMSDDIHTHKLCSSCLFISF